MVFIIYSASENIVVATHRLLVEGFFGRVLAMEFLDQRVHVFKSLIDIGELSSRKAVLIFILSMVYVNFFFLNIFLFKEDPGLCVREEAKRREPTKNKWWPREIKMFTQ